MGAQDGWWWAVEHIVDPGGRLGCVAYVAGYARLDGRTPQGAGGQTPPSADGANIFLVLYFSYIAYQNVTMPYTEDISSSATIRK